MLGGSGGSQVDVVFYVILNRIKPVDIEYLKRLASMTNVIPLIAQSDALSAEQLSSLKTTILSELQAANIRPFLFGLSPEDALRSDYPCAPYAISTITGKDHDTMDASLLMSPDYVQPLVISELAALVERVFERDAISWLRNSAAKKFIQWRNSSAPSRPQDLYRPLSTSQSMISSASQMLTGPARATTSYALARITDHTIREERLAQVRLSNWAADLQRSLQNERARFDALARGERAVWLTERLGECVQDGTIIPISEARQQQFSPTSGALVNIKQNSRKGAYSRRSTSSAKMALNPQDPLGILQLNADLKQRGLTALKVISGFSIIGGIAYWVSVKNDWGRAAWWTQEFIVKGFTQNFIWGLFGW